jgi:two-component system response regulator QseB
VTELSSAPTPTVLLVEDDRRLAEMVTALLVEEGYCVEVAGGGQAGLHMGLTRHYGVLIIDRGLPVLEGLELLRKLRSNGISTPALILTARGSLTDRVEGLDAGAEDYLVKPFEVPELLARIRALLRRHTDTAQFLPLGRRRLSLTDRAVLGGEGDTGAGVSGAGGTVALSERECRLLAVLAGSPEQVFTRPQLLARVFDQADTVGTVDTYVHYLRRKLGRESIQTVRGLGYRLGSS